MPEMTRFPRTNEEWAEHNRLCLEEYERDHGPDSHDCPRQAFCYEDPECEYAQCDTCGAPNGRCQCDFLYERWKDERYG